MFLLHAVTYVVHCFWLNPGLYLSSSLYDAGKRQNSVHYFLFQVFLPMALVQTVLQSEIDCFESNILMCEHSFAVTHHPCLHGPLHTFSIKPVEHCSNLIICMNEFILCAA